MVIISANSCLCRAFQILLLISRIYTYLMINEKIWYGISSPIINLRKDTSIQTAYFQCCIVIMLPHYIVCMSFLLVFIEDRLVHFSFHEIAFSRIINISSLQLLATSFSRWSPSSSSDRIIKNCARHENIILSFCTYLSGISK